MIPKPTSIMFLLFAGIGWVAGTPGSDPDAPQKQSAKAAAGSMTGCIDQQNGSYVLIDAQDRKPIASLEADGFPTEGFAKYVGTKVTVRGTVNSGASVKQVKVRAIEKISDTCTTTQGKN